MTKRTLALIAGCNYFIIFFAAIYANFSVLDALKADPLNTVQSNSFGVRLGIMAFLLAAIADVIVAWALNAYYKNHILSSISTYFRIIHAAIMGAAVYLLVPIISFTSSTEILDQVQAFDTLWLIGLVFFGVHLLLLGKIIDDVKYIPWILMLAGAMYIVDTSAHFLMEDYEQYAQLFLLLVAIPSVAGEMAYTLWLLIKGGKQ